MLYELFCLAKPALSKPALTEIMRTASQAVLAKGGVLTDIKSFGQRPLAYDIRKPGERYAEASKWSAVITGGVSLVLQACTCLPSPSLLPDSSRLTSKQAHMWQLTFSSPPSVLPDLDHLLRVDERVLRWMVLRRRPYAPLPNTYRVARAAAEVAASLEQQPQQHLGKVAEQRH